MYHDCELFISGFSLMIHAPQPQPGSRSHQQTVSFTKKNCVQDLVVSVEGITDSI
jgi:hypothetical protein